MRPGSGTPVFNGVLDHVENWDAAVKALFKSELAGYRVAGDIAFDDPETADLVSQDNTEPRLTMASDSNVHSILLGMFVKHHFVSRGN